MEVASKSSAVKWIRGLIFVLIFCTAIDYGFAMDNTKDAHNFTSAVGDYVVFNCHLDFPHELPIPYILHWNRDGHSIFSWYEVPGNEKANNVLSVDDEFVGRIHLLDGPNANDYGQGSINLTNIRESDQGWYECKVIFPDRSPSSRNNGTWFYLSIEGLSHVDNKIISGENILAVPPINRTAMEGENVEFDCVAKDSSSIITWLRDGINIPQIEDLRDRASIVNNGSLKITPAAVGDLGEYTCIVTDNLGDQQSASAYLNVQYKAKVIYAQKEVYFPYGKQAILDCHFRANPPLTNLRWEKDGFLFDPYNVPGVFYRRNGSLYFSKVDETHSGSYSCTPYNELGTDGPSPSITVVVQRPPIFTVTPQRLYMRKLGESLEIPCEAKDGDQSQQPSIVWFKDGSPLSQDRAIVNGGNLTIEKVQEQDRGLYQCSASNGAATVVADAELVILSYPPRAPYGLWANSSKNSITLTWVPGYVRPKMEYAVWYRPTDTSEWKTIKIPSKKITEATIPNLIPGQEYEFMVLSQDKNGDGMFSKSLRVLTQSKIEGTNKNSASELRGGLGPPENIRVQVTGEGYLVTWDPPLKGRDSLKNYVVRWFRETTDSIYGKIETADTFYLVKNLEEEKKYIFEILAISVTDEISTSEQFTLEVPTLRRNRTISMSLVAIMGFLAAGLMTIWWMRKKFCRSTSNK
ncbi:protein borderless isoform X2 [Aphidius gifuensis]|uniref:protein borderless isoform X2 n=1 Tax=Aphidius gifuensis TaxID=684658 RepID=UPI001CDC8D43|nr:protein borderless isoform X2 [Aphidius gifuensis]